MTAFIIIMMILHRFSSFNQHKVVRKKKTNKDKIKEKTKKMMMKKKKLMKYQIHLVRD